MSTKSYTRIVCLLVKSYHLSLKLPCSDIMVKADVHHRVKHHVRHCVALTSQFDVDQSTPHCRARRSFNASATQDEKPAQLRPASKLKIFIDVEVNAAVPGGLLVCFDIGQCKMRQATVPELFTVGIMRCTVTQFTFKLWQVTYRYRQAYCTYSTGSYQRTRMISYRYRYGQPTGTVPCIPVLINGLLTWYRQAYGYWEWHGQMVPLSINTGTGTYRYRIGRYRQAY